VKVTNLTLTDYRLSLYKIMRVIFILLTIAATLLSILIAGLIILSISVGGGNVLLPGFGLVIALPFFIFVLMIIDAAIIALAFLIRRLSLKKFV
jgi:hypothetical protein